MNKIKNNWLIWNTIYNPYCKQILQGGSIINKEKMTNQIEYWTKEKNRESKKRDSMTNTHMKRC